MKTEVRRGRKFVEYIDDSLPVGTFVQEIGAHDVSYLDENGAWLPADENWAADGLDGYIFKADKLNHKTRLKGNGGRAWYPRRNVNTEYLTFGIPQYWTGSKWSNFGFSGWSVEGKTITLNTRQNVTILVHSLWSGIKIDWVLANASAPKRMRYPVALTGITEIAGVLFGADGVELGRITPTTATDANGAELPCSGSYANRYVEFSADVTGTVFPVTIDPDFSTTSTAGDVTFNSGSYANRNFGTSPTLAGLVGCFIMRFDCSSIDGSALATAATLTFTKTSTQSSAGSNNLTFYGITSANGDWIEGVTANPARSGEPCWNAKQADGSGGVTVGWAGSAGLATAGTDYVDTALTDTIDINRNAAQYSKHTATFNASGLTLIKSWFGTNDSNYGIKSTCSQVSTVASSENSTESYRPVLIVDYSAGNQTLTLTCAAGSYSLAGVACTLTYTPAAQNLTLSCGAGSLALTGSACTLSVKRNFVLSCSAGSYAVTGTSASLTKNLVMACESGGAYPDIIVSGAGTTDANGTYVYGGMYQEKPYYLYSDYLIFRTTWEEYELCEWTIAHGDLYSYSPLYSSGEVSYIGVDTPDLVTTWQKVGAGTLPVPTVAAGTSLSYILTGSDVTLTYTQGAQNLTLSCGAGIYALTGTAATMTVQRNYTLACSAGSYSLVGTNVNLTVQRNFALVCASGSYSVLGTDASLSVGHTLACDTGAYGLTGVNVDFALVRNFTLALDSGTYALTGSAVSLILQGNPVLLAESGAYALTGNDVSIVASISVEYELTCDTGAYLITGADATLSVQRNRVLEVGSGSYALTGADAAIELARHYLLTLGSGAYGLTGADVTISASIGARFELGCSAGAYSLTGTPIVIGKGLTIPLASGAYALTGRNADLPFGRTVSLENGGYVLSGVDALFEKQLIFTVDEGDYFLTGTNILITAGAITTPMCRTLVIEAENRVYAIPYECRTSVIEPENRTSVIEAENRTSEIEAENRVYSIKC